LHPAKTRASNVPIIFCWLGEGGGMIVKKILNFCAVFVFISFISVIAEEGQVVVLEEVNSQPAQQETTKEKENLPAQQEELKISAESNLSTSENVTLDFNEADIHNVLKIISLKAGTNIVTTPDVMGNVTIRMVDVPWEMALDVILKTYGFGYQKQGNIILVTKIENVAKIASEEPLQTEIITLKFLDAQDAQKIIIPLLSPRGKTSVLYARGQKGWQFGTFKIGKDATGSSAALQREKEGQAKSETVSYEKDAAGGAVMKKAEFDPSVKSKMLIITDTYSTLERIRTEILPKIDVKPKQVLVEAKFMEVNKTRLKDLGLDWGLGSSTNAESLAIATQTIKAGTQGIGGHLLGTATTGALLTSANPYTAGGEFVFKKLTGTQFEAVIHALENDVTTNTLSSPSILTLDNQEASMLVGYHTPILQSTVTAGSDTTNATVTQTLDYYQEIGIRLNVVPQISEEGYINMIVHPSITSSSDSVDATSTAGDESTVTSYPIIDVREAQTQVLLNDGETIVIGGLLKDVKTKTRVGIPFLVDLPWVGKLFGRDKDNVEKVDLLIFITAKIIKEGEYSPEELAKLEKRLNQGEVVVDLKSELADNKKKE
jgi:type IV pilus assembly protein PilQ